MIYNALGEKVKVFGAVDSNKIFWDGRSNNRPVPAGIYYVSANFMGEEIIARILFTQPFLGGHRSIIDLGWMPLEDLTKTLLRQDPIKMKFLDSDDIKITEYFDIPENSWSNRGLLDALLRASSMCGSL